MAAYTVVAAACGNVFKTSPENLAVILSGRDMCLQHNGTMHIQLGVVQVHN